MGTGIIFEVRAQYFIPAGQRTHVRVVNCLVVLRERIEAWDRLAHIVKCKSNAADAKNARRYLIDAHG